MEEPPHELLSKVLVGIPYMDFRSTRRGILCSYGLLSFVLLVALMGLAESSIHDLPTRPLTHTPCKARTSQAWKQVVNERALSWHFGVAVNELELSYHDAYIHIYMYLYMYGYIVNRMASELW